VPSGAELIGVTTPRCAKRSELAMTETELALIAALTIIGLSRSPNRG
jgi:hypothetical protein